jgi:Holliday junction resolvasome RuvABC ATP-dependent DNA helicase subunit
MNVDPNPSQLPTEELLFNILRAQNWSEFFGQQQIKNSLMLAIKAASNRSENLDSRLAVRPTRTRKNYTFTSHRQRNGSKY